MEKVENKGDMTNVPFEAALDETGFGLYSWLLTILAGLSTISFVCIVYGGQIIVPTSQCELDTTVGQQSLLISSSLLGSVIGSIGWGYMADREGRRKMLLASFSLAIFVNGITSLSVNWLMLLVFQFFNAFIASGQYGMAMTLLSECIPMAKRNMAVLIVASIFLVAQGIMSLLAVPIIPLEFSYYLPALGIYWNSWRTTMLLYGTPSLICFCCMYFMQESPKYVYLKKSEEESMKILKIIHSINNRNAVKEFQVKSLDPETVEATDKDKQSESKIALLFKGQLLKYFIICTTLFVFQQTGAFFIWLPTILNQFVNEASQDGSMNFTLCDILMQQNEEEETSCSLNVPSLLMVFGASAITGSFNLVLSLVVNKSGRRNAVIAIASVCGMSGILVNLIPNTIASVVFFAIYLVAVVLQGLYTAISIALFPTHLRALAVSLTMAGGYLMFFISAPVLNILINNNCEVAFYIFASLIVASAVIASFLPDDRNLMKTESKQELQD